MKQKSYAKNQIEDGKENSMLTKNDLLQIGEVVRPIIQKEITVALKPIKWKLDKLRKDFHAFVDHFDQRLSSVETDIKLLKQN